MNQILLVDASGSHSIFQRNAVKATHEIDLVAKSLKSIQDEKKITYTQQQIIIIITYIKCMQSSQKECTNL